MNGVLLERRAEFLSNKRKYEERLEQEIAAELCFFDDYGSSIVNHCSEETQHEVLEIQERTLHEKSAKLVEDMKKLQGKVLDEIKHSSLKGS